MAFLASSFFLHSRGIFLPLWMEDFAVDRTGISLVVSLTLFTGNCCAPITGFLIDKYPVKAIVCIGSLWLATGYLLLQFVDTYVAFLMTFIVFQGIGWTYVGPLVHTKLMVNWFARNRGMALGIAIMGISVAGIIMPTVATFLSETLGWRGAYSVYAVVLIALIIPATLAVVKQDPSVIGQHPDGDRVATQEAIAARALPPQTEGIAATYKEFLTSKAFWSVVITFGLMNGVYSAMITHLPSYLTTELDFDMYDASYALGVAGVFAITGKVVFGWMMDHINAKGTVMLAVAAYFSSTVAFMSFDSYAMIMIAAGLFGLGFGGMVPVRSVLISRLFGIRKFSRVNGLLSFFIAPATFWVLITGYVADSTGTYVTAFQLWAVAFVVAGIVTAMIKLPNREDAVL
ncbi:MAG: MFS transporter [Gammaproteobacteria bacterium]|nr:MFS transporter [Gammaproteobacteria bacterium]